jgi:hypothetical protein
MRLLTEYRDEMLHRSFGMYIATGDTANINNLSMKAAEIPPGRWV